MRHRQPRQPKLPTPPKPPKPERPRVRDLRAIYKGLVVLDQGQRLAVIAQAMNWYDKALLYTVFKLGGQLTAQQAKQYDIATKARGQGLGTNYLREKETAYRTAIRIYEKICVGLEPVKIDDYYSVLDRKEKKLEQKQEKIEERWGDIAQLIQKVLKPTNPQGHVIDIKVGQVKEPYQPDPTLQSITLRRDVAKELNRMRYREGLLPMSLTIIRQISRLCCQEPERDTANNFTGRYVVSLQKQRTLEHKMLDNLVTFAQSEEAPRRLVKQPIAAAAPTNGTGTAVAKTPRQPGKAPMRGPKVGGYFVQGSDVAWLYTTLSDKNWHPMDELQKKISAKLTGRLRKIDKTGRRSIAAKGEGFTVETQGNQVRLNFTVPKTTQQVQP